MWRKVTEKNDWGYIITYAGKNHELIIPKSKKLRVRFPDGTEHLLPVVLEENIEHVNDMGQEYTVRSQVPYIRVEIFGLKTEIKLLGLEVYQENETNKT